MHPYPVGGGTQVKAESVAVTDHAGTIAGRRGLHCEQPRITDPTNPIMIIVFHNLGGQINKKWGEGGRQPAALAAVAAKKSEIVKAKSRNPMGKPLMSADRR